MRIFLIAHEVSRAEGRDPLTTALTPSEQSGLTQFLVQFARGTRVCLKPTEMKMDQKEKEERERERESRRLTQGTNCQSRMDYPLKGGDRVMVCDFNAIFERFRFV